MIKANDRQQLHDSRIKAGIKMFSFSWIAEVFFSLHKFALPNISHLHKPVAHTFCCVIHGFYSVEQHSVKGEDHMHRLLTSFFFHNYLIETAYSAKAFELCFPTGFIYLVDLIELEPWKKS